MDDRVHFLFYRRCVGVRAVHYVSTITFWHFVLLEWFICLLTIEQKDGASQIEILIWLQIMRTCVNVGIIDCITLISFVLFELSASVIFLLTLELKGNVSLFISAVWLAFVRTWDCLIIIA